MGSAAEKEGDLKYPTEGISNVIGPASAEFLQGTHLDFVELEPGNSNFIFQKPNNPSCKPPVGGGDQD
jgi:Fe-S cluster assembly iron-binding protein IscA